MIGRWLVVSLFATVVPVTAAAQTRGVDVTYGRWWHGEGAAATVVGVSLSKTWFGPLAYGIGINHASDNESLVNRSISGAELFLRAGGQQGPGGVFGIGAVGIGRRHSNGEFDAQWSLGLGYSYDLLSFMRLTAEARYRMEDQLINGFWNKAPSDRRGLLIGVGFALRFGGARTTPSPPVARPPVRRPPTEPASEPDGGSNRRPALATIGRLPGSETAIGERVVETALDAMGSPYRWGGSGDNGFDCSGLIQFAYAEHGILIPRISRDQARYGEYVEPRVDQLQPGDILGFAVSGGRVSHVGLYVGGGDFIHSSSTGVKLSSLTATDGDSLWYQRRWVVARRVLN